MTVTGEMLELARPELKLIATEPDQARLMAGKLAFDPAEHHGAPGLGRNHAQSVGSGRSFGPYVMPFQAATALALLRDRQHERHAA